MYDFSGLRNELGRFGPGLYTLSDGTFPSSLNDDIESIAVPAGLQVTACQHGDGAGICESYTADVLVLPAGLNDEVSWLLVEAIPLP